MEHIPRAFKEEPDNSDVLLDPSIALAGRFVHLDVTRVCCIVCVVLNVFDRRFATWNTLYAQNWVLQLLWVICGLCFGLSQRPFMQYIGRLSLYFCMGVLANWSVWLIYGWQWLDSVWMVISQMIFVLWLIVICLLLAPLRQHLRALADAGGQRDEPEEERPRGEAAARGQLAWGGLVIGSGVLAIVLLFSLLLNSGLRDACAALSRGSITFGIVELRDEEAAAAFGLGVGRYLQTCLSGLWIVLSFPRVFKSYSAVFWLLLLNFYVQRLAFSYSTADLPFHGFYLVMLALTAHHFGIAHKRLLGKLVHRYWMVVTFGCTFLWTPGLRGPMPSHPPEDIYVRERYILMEAVFLVAWLTAGQHMFDARIFTEDKLGWVNEWAILLFLVHQAVSWAFPWHVSSIVLVLIGPACWLCRSR